MTHAWGRLPGPMNEPAPRPASAVSVPAVRAVSIAVDYDPCFGYAGAANAVPMLRSVRITNIGATDLDDVRVGVAIGPELAPRVERAIGRLPAGAVHNLAGPDLARPSAQKLALLTAAEPGEIAIDVACGAELLARSTYPVELLPAAEWAGTRSLPELLAAFVLPHHPAVEPVLRRAGELFTARSAGAPGATFGGYGNGGPDRARLAVAAVYEAIAELGLIRQSSPPGFETRGQVVRTPGELVESRVATCLDLALLAAAVLEQAGLHPVVVLAKGHALLACWLVDACFVDATVDEARRLAKQLELGTMVALDVQGALARPPASFDAAARAGARHLALAEGFLYATDVRAARRERIMPAAPRGVVEIGTAPAIPARRLHAPTQAGARRAPTSDDDAGPGRPADVGLARLDRWKRRLLDLSLANRFLNFRPGPKAVPLAVASPTELVRRLAAGESFAVHAAPRPGGARGQSTVGVPPVAKGQGAPGTTTADASVASEGASEGDGEFLAAELAAGRLRAELGERELDRRMVAIYRAARAAIEEGGANTLFLACGFLVWRDPVAAPGVALRAPVLLVPLEVSRNAVGEGCRVAASREEARVNVALLEKLKVDFGVDSAALQPPTDGPLDAAALFAAFRALALGREGWSLATDAVVGLFSFTKYLMWRDLEDRGAALAQSPVLAHLLEGPRAPYDTVSSFARATGLDERPDCPDCPLDADGSQLAAIHAACAGRSFVLEGPPGTGKSQTIANLIACAISGGKRVLFVAAKMAALEVVHRRLAELGLGPYALELHSHKTDKAELVARLALALERPEPAPDGADDLAWASLAESTRGVRAQLNAYARLIHDKKRLGESAYEVVARLVAMRGEPARDERASAPPLAFDPTRDATRARFEELLDATRRIGVVLADLRGLAANPWAASALEEWRPTLEEQVRALALALASAAKALATDAVELAGALAVAPRPFSREDTDELIAAGELLAASPGPTRALLLDSGWEATRTRIAGWIELGKETNALEAQLTDWDAAELGRLELNELLAELKAAARDAWPWRARRFKAVARALVRAFRGARMPPPVELVGVLERARALGELVQRFARADGEATTLLGPHWKGRATDWDHVARLVDWASRFRRLHARAEPGDEELRRAERWVGLAIDHRGKLDPAERDGKRLARLVASKAAVLAATSALERLLVLDPVKAWGPPSEPGYTQRLVDTAERWRDGLGQLRGWTAYQRARHMARAHGLEALLDRVVSRSLSLSDLEGEFRRAYYAWWIALRFEEEQQLRRFNGAEHDHRAREFATKDKELTRRAAARIVAAVRARIPGPDERDPALVAQMGELAREAKRTRGALPIRALLAKVPDLVGRVAPCLMMSPLSVAQYLGPEIPPFDLVVFDEASQVPMWDALGAISRARAVVVVGDSRQLPPTNFFVREEAGTDYEEEDCEEMESVLDECAAARLASLELGWHYRSRHESMVAFSNARYYGGRLLTFPAARDRHPRSGARLGVHLRVVAGTYDRGRHRTNEAEARAITDEVAERLADPARRDQSIGIVTFNMAQQVLIENALDALRRDRPALEPAFEGVEPVFVKNLENVQGDERDVVLFSVCYGPDADGRVAMNFGPLNRAGGERRLNVAVTRARDELVVFASMRAGAIDLARTSSVGVRHLKEFLEYAEGGTRVLGQELAGGALRPADGLAEAIRAELARALDGERFAVEAGVGCSGYRLDLAVADRTRPGEYLLGIETDGPAYASARTARDRDRLRGEVLARLGWSLVRVWSTDWWLAPAGELDKLVAAVHARAAARDAQDGPRRVGGTDVPAGPPVVPVVAGGAAQPVPVTRTTEPPVGARPATVVPRGATAISGQVRTARPYKSAPVEIYGTSEQFFEPGHDAIAVQAIEMILAWEAPITGRLLCQRLAAMWGHTKPSRRIRDRMDALVPADIQRTPCGDDVVYWGPGQHPDRYSHFRGPGPGDIVRKSEDLPIEELANAVASVLEVEPMLAEGELARAAAKLFGHARVPRGFADGVEAALALLARRGRVAREGGVARLLR